MQKDDRWTETTPFHHPLRLKSRSRCEARTPIGAGVGERGQEAQLRGRGRHHHRGVWLRCFFFFFLFAEHKRKGARIDCAFFRYIFPFSRQGGCVSRKEKPKPKRPSRTISTRGLARGGGQGRRRPNRTKDAFDVSDRARGWVGPGVGQDEAQGYVNDVMTSVVRFLS